MQQRETLLDIGCGWGGLVRHAAEHYGVDATGVTISAAQAELARRRIEEAGHAIESTAGLEVLVRRRNRFVLGNAAAARARLSERLRATGD